MQQLEHAGAKVEYDDMVLVVGQPSLLAPPQLIELGESYDPTTEQAVVRLEAKIEKK